MLFRFLGPSASLPQRQGGFHPLSNFWIRPLFTSGLRAWTHHALATIWITPESPRSLPVFLNRRVVGVVMQAMSNARHDFKILWDVVQLVAVNVMHDLYVQQPPAVRGFPDQSMFQRITAMVCQVMAWDFETTVSIPINGDTAFPLWRVRTTKHAFRMIRQKTDMPFVWRSPREHFTASAGAWFRAINIVHTRPFYQMAA